MNSNQNTKREKKAATTASEATEESKAPAKNTNAEKPKGKKGGENQKRDRQPRNQQAAEDGENQAATAGNGDSANKTQSRGQNNRQTNNRGGQRQNQDQDKNSYIYKFHNMERPKWEKINFTADTEIPALPSKEQRIKEPSKKDFDDQMAELDRQIQVQRKARDAIIREKKQMREGGLMGGTSGDKTRRQELTERSAVLKSVREQRRALLDTQREFNQKIEAHEQEKQNLFKVTKKDCRTVESVNQAIKDLEYRLTTTSTSSSNQERQMIKEIDQLKNSIDHVKKLQEIEPLVKELKDQKKEISAKLTKVREEENRLQSQMEKIRKELEVVNQEKTETKEELDRLQEKITKIDEQITELYSQKDQRREEYWKARYDHKVQRDHIAHIEWMTNQKARALEALEEKEKLKQEHQSAISNLPHPYLKELETCDHLTHFLNKLKVQAGLIVDNEALARQAQAAELEEANKEKMAQKVSDGRLMIAESKKDREAAAVVQIGGGKKRKGKKQKAAVEYEDTFNIDIVLIKKFAQIGVTAPIQSDEIDARLDEIAKKKVYYEEHGATRLQEQIEELKKLAQEEVEMYEQLDESDKQQTRDSATDDAEESQAGRSDRRQGRGGYRGGRQGGARGGRGRGRLAAYRERNEFEGDDEEEDLAYSAPMAKPRRAKQRQEDLVVDDNNYPTIGGAATSKK